MDRQMIIDELAKERNRIQRAIDLLNGVPVKKPAANAPTSSTRQSSPEARQAQSLRMKAYWRKKRRAA